MTNIDFVKSKIFYGSLPILSVGVINGSIEVFGGVPGDTFDVDGVFDYNGCIVDLLDNMILLLGVSGSVGDSLKINSGDAVRMLQRRRNDFAGVGLDYILGVDENDYVLNLNSGV